MERLHALHSLHADKLARLQAQRLQCAQAEEREMAEHRARARAHSHSSLTCASSGQEASERLYRDRVVHDRRVRELQRRVEEDERARVDASRVARQVGARSSSASQLRCAREACSRLHGLHEERELRLARQREEAAASEVAGLDRVGAAAAKRGAAPGLHDRLHADAEKRRARSQKARAASVAREMRAACGAKKRAQPMDESRLEHLVGERARLERRWQAEAVERAEREQRAIQKAAESARALWKPLRLQNVPARFIDAVATPRQCTPAQPNDSVTLGFGSKVARLVETVAPKCRIESVDHALATVNAMVALRCGGVPEDAPAETLRDLVAPLNEAMQAFRDALEESASNGEGFEHLKLRPSQRLFCNGKLLEDQVGWHKNCEPDPLVQLEDRLEALLASAAAAQEALLAKVGPGHGDVKQLGARWPKGGRWNTPQVCRAAMFAYNPGPKGAEEAARKAAVRFGPAEGDRRHRHLLDLARATLVFSDAAMLRVGLEQLVQELEVVDVRNYYQSGHQGLLGERFVELLVVLKDGLSAPHICELRLEELCFFVARERARPHLEQVGRAFRGIYGRRSLDEGAIEYLARWALRRPKEPHGTTVFRRHLARRFGSTVVAWRRRFGNGRLVPFLAFREACCELLCGDRAGELWSSLDCGRGGCISLFELDPEAVLRLTRLRGRIQGLAPSGRATGGDLFAGLTAKSVCRPGTAGRLEPHEFRTAAQPLGFSSLEAEQLFEYLDLQGGCRHAPPASVTVSDVAWLQKLVGLVHVPTATLASQHALTDEDEVRAVTWAGAARVDARRARTPAAMIGRHSLAVVVTEPPATAAAGAVPATPRGDLRAGKLAELRRRHSGLSTSTEGASTGDDSSSDATQAVAEEGSSSTASDAESGEEVF